jgi:hypothetical protein
MKTRIFLSLLLCHSILKSEGQSNFIGAGIAMSFNGSAGSYVDLGDSYNSLAFPFSFETWTMPTSYSSLYPGIFGCDVNSVGNYYGFWIRIRSTGTLEVEFGNGLGANPGGRRGFRTTDVVPLNKWVHLAVVCNSVTDVHIYFNGVEKNLVPTEGTSTLTTLLHSSGHANLGRSMNSVNESDFIGKIDEARLWDISRSITDIRENMCRKVDTDTTAGLIGYWKADESYTSGTVMDFTNPSENGTINGSVAKVTSGAAIGNQSEYLYTADFTDAFVSIFSPSGERLGADTITGNPYGVQVYRVDSTPYYTDGLLATPPFYFGVFCAESNTTAHYSVFYRYRNNNGIFNSDNEDDLALMNKADDSQLTWTDIGGSQNLFANRIKKSGETTRGEYILNLTSAEKTAANSADLPPDQIISTYPNPADKYVVIDLEGTPKLSDLNVYDLNGRLLSRQQFAGSHIVFERGDLPGGIYLLTVVSDAVTISTGKIVFE